MILDFTITNYRSIYEAASINMIASREQEHRDRCPVLPKRYRKTVNPIAAIFGANAAGKSTLINAMRTLKELVINAPRPGDPMPFEPFGLNQHAIHEPTTFELLFEWEDFIYEYILTYDAERVVEEQLTKILSKTDQALFVRSTEQFEFPHLESQSSTLSEQAKAAATLLRSVPDKMPLASYVGEINLGSLSDQLGLSTYTTVKRFLEQVVVIPAGVNQYPSKGAEFGTGQNLITEVDAGIVGFRLKPAALPSLGVSEDTLREYSQQICSFGGPLNVELPNGRFVVSLEGNTLSAERISLEHATRGARSQHLKWMDESDGTKAAARLLGLFELYARPEMRGVVMIDEIDRSCHTELLKALVNGFLQSSHPQSRTQVLFTTHDLLLMDPQLLRRDEILLVEKDHNGQTNITALSDFEEPRKTTDLRKNYLQGRFGGVPSIQPLESSRG